MACSRNSKYTLPVSLIKDLAPSTTHPLYEYRYLHQRRRQLNTIARPFYDLGMSNNAQLPIILAELGALPMPKHVNDPVIWIFRAMHVLERQPSFDSDWRNTTGAHRRYRKDFGLEDEETLLYEDVYGPERFCSD